MWFLLAHGAGASSASPWMKRWASLLQTLGPVKSFDYPYIKAGKRMPDRLPRLIEAHRQELAAGKAEHGEQVILVGKSMGSRVGCHLSLEESVRAVVCLGYPLKGISKTAPLRDQVLLDMRVPACFVQGTRDKLCPLESLEEVLQRRTAPSQLHIVETGDHSLEATKTFLKKSGQTQDDLDSSALEVISTFVASARTAS